MPYRLLFALGAGVAAGLGLRPWAAEPWLSYVDGQLLQPFGQLFLRLMLMAVVPLLVSGLVVGVYELGRARGLGRIARRTLGYTLLTSALSVAIGLLLVNTLRPGSGLDLSLASAPDLQPASVPLSQILVELVPRNPVEAAARALDGQLVSLMVFAILFGVALSRTSSAADNPLVAVLDQIYQASLRLVTMVMTVAPFAVFALVFHSVLSFGMQILGALLGYVGVVLLGLALQQFVVYGGLLAASGRSPWQFFARCREVYLFAFSTASSNATLPQSLATAEEKLKLKPEVARFVLTLGATGNQNGTALFEGVTVLFLAQAYGLDLALAQQVQVVLLSIVAGIGTAGVPGGSLPLILTLVTSLGIPAEGMGLILGVDRLLDMARTTVNVSGDLVVAALVQGRGDGEPPPARTPVSPLPSPVCP